MSSKPARCHKCHRILKSAAAIAVGYGPVCYRKMFGKTSKRSGAGVARRKVASYRARKVAGYQISFFDVEEVNHDSLDQQEAR